MGQIKKQKSKRFSIISQTEKHYDLKIYVFIHNCEFMLRLYEYA
jgi:hypothetical protein